MSTEDYLTASIHAAPPLTPLSQLKEQIDTLAMSSDAERTPGEKKDEGASSPSDSLHPTPIDVGDLQQNPGNYTIADIKRFLRERDLPTRGKKEELIQRLVMYG